MRCVLIGNYGVGNLGDEALKEYFLRTFINVEWGVLSAQPTKREYPRLPAGIASLFLTPWWRTISVIFKSDAVVFGGGSLFTDAESVFACFLWWWHVVVAWVFRKPVYLAFQGIGPFRTRIGEWFARCAVRVSSSLSVRDDQSKNQVDMWELNKKVVLTFDPVFLLLKKTFQKNSSKKVFVLIPRSNSSATFCERAGALVRTQQGDAVCVLSLQPEAAGEKRTCAQLARAVRGTVVPIRSLADLSLEVAAASFVLAQRYHGALAALALGTDFDVVPQREGDKLSALRDLRGREEECVRLVQAGEDALRAALHKN